MFLLNLQAFTCAIFCTCKMRYVCARVCAWDRTRLKEKPECSTLETLLILKNKFGYVVTKLLVFFRYYNTGFFMIT